MASLVLYAAHRPLRVGFLVREREISDVLAAATLNTVLWGGIHNPMIPICTNNELAKQLVRLFRVDVLHPITEAPQLKTFFAENGHLAWPEHPVGESDLFRRDDRGRRLNVVDMLAWYQKSKWRRTRQTFCVVGWDDTDPLALSFACAFGKFPSSQYQEAYARGLEADEVPIPLGLAVPDSLATGATPVDATRTWLMPDAFNGRTEPGIFLGHPNETEDLIAFWNLRAAGAGLAFCPLTAIDRAMGYITQHMEGCAKWARMGAHRRLTLWARRGQTVPERIMELFPKDLQSGLSSVDDVIWNGMNVKPAVYRLEDQSVLANLDTASEAPPLIDFHLRPMIDVNELLSAHRGQQFVADIHPLSESSYEGCTLRLPYLPDLCEWYSRETVLLPGGLRVGFDSVGLIRHLYEETAHVRPVRFEVLIPRIFERAGIQAEPSHKGRIAQQLIAQMGGLEGCRIFKIRGVRKLIASDNARDGLTRGTATLTILDKDIKSGEASFNQYARLFIEGRPQSNTDEVFNNLLRREIFRPGLRLVCPKCTLDFWAAMPLSETCRCEYCGHTFLLAPHLKDRGDWQFRLSGLFGRKAGEEGAIPVALTLLQLLRIVGISETVIYTCNSDLTGAGLRCEVDLVAVSRKEKGHVEITLGECKGAGEITAQDVQNIMTAGRILKNSGLDFYPLFAKTSDSFCDVEIERFRSLLAQNVEPILFTARELEPYHPFYESPDRERMPEPYARDLAGMARNSRALYLG